MRTKMLITTGCVLLLVSTTAADPGDTLWTRTYGGSNGEEGYSVQQTSDGGYIIAGMTSSFGAGGGDFYLVKTDSSGDTLWTRTYGGSRNDYGYSVQQTSDGGYIITGQTISFGAGFWDVYLVKTDPSGDTLWTRTYGGSDAEGGYSVQQTSDGGYIIAGYTFSFGAGDHDSYLVKTDSSGGTLWTHTYGGSSNEFGMSVQQTSDGGYIIAGMTQSFGAGSNDVYLVRTDSSGDTLWTRTYGGSRDDYGYSVQQTSDGGYIVAGYTESFGAGESDVYLVKTDSSGDSLWTGTYGEGGYDYEEGYSVEETSDGGYIITGVAWDYAVGYDVYLVKTDSSGDSLWSRTYGGSNDDYGQSVQETSDGGFIIAGYTMSFGAGSFDLYMVKTAGGVEMVCEYLGPWLCRGTNFSFKLTIYNATGENVSGTLTFSGYLGYDCDPGNALVDISRGKSYPPGTTQEYYRFTVPNAVGPGQYSAAVRGTLGDADLLCCMNVDIVECGPWKSGGNTEWELVELDRPEFEASLPTQTELYSNYPNPFNASTQFSYSLAEAGNVKLTIHNLRGQLVETVVDGHQETGEHQVIWDASDYSSGVYFYKLQAGDFTSTKKMNLLK